MAILEAAGFMFDKRDQWMVFMCWRRGAFMTKVWSGIWMELKVILEWKRIVVGGGWIHVFKCRVTSEIRLKAWCMVHVTMKMALAVQYCPQFSCLYRSNGYFGCHSILYQLLKFCSVGCWIGKDIAGSVRDLFWCTQLFWFSAIVWEYPGNRWVAWLWGSLERCSTICRNLWKRSYCVVADTLQL
jgi:hypothetical protein